MQVKNVGHAKTVKICKIFVKNFDANSTKPKKYKKL